MLIIIMRPCAAPRSACGKTSSKMAVEAGIAQAAPMPSTARPASKIPELVEQPAHKGDAGAGDEQQQTDAEDAQPAEPVAQRAADGDKARQQHQADVENPLAGRDGHAERALHTGQADLRRRHVDGPG
jgi:hypothetical protein